MKKAPSLLLAIPCYIAFFFISSISAPGQSADYVVRSTVSTCLNVRSDHDTEADEIACLSPGTSVKVVNTVPFWREIIFGNNQRGWVAKKFIETATTVEDITDPANITIPDEAMLTVHFVDVGQGDAIWIQTHDDNIDGNGIFEGYSTVIDGGPYSSDINNPLRTYIEEKAHHGAELEALILTHPHDDHYSGAEMISRHFAINHYYDPAYPLNKPGYLAFLNAMQGSDGNAGRARHLHIGKQNFGKMDWGAELNVEVLYSWAGDPDNTLGSGNTEQNNSSIVLRIEYGEHSFLFMGDAEGKDRDDSPSTPKYVEKILLEASPDKLKSTVLKIAHHGSETSSTIPFIEAVDPEIVVVQSGRKSFHGGYLPDASTLQRYCTFNPNVRIYRNDQDDENVAKVRDAVDEDHIIIQTNGKGKPDVEVFNGGQAFTGNFCEGPIN